MPLNLREFWEITFNFRVKSRSSDVEIFLDFDLSTGRGRFKVSARPRKNLGNFVVFVVSTMVPHTRDMRGR